MSYYKVFNETLNKIALLGVSLVVDAEKLAENPKLAQAAQEAEDLLARAWNVLNESQQVKD